MEIKSELGVYDKTANPPNSLGGSNLTLFFFFFKFGSGLNLNFDKLGISGSGNTELF